MLSSRHLGVTNHGFYKLSPYFERFSAIFEKIKALFYTRTPTGTALDNKHFSNMSIVSITMDPIEVH